MVNQPFPRWEAIGAVLLGMAALLGFSLHIGCDATTPPGKKTESGTKTDKKTPDGNAPGVSTRAEAIQVLNDAAEVLEGINDQQTLEAAKPKMEAFGKRLQPHKPVITTAVYLGGLAPGVPPQMQRSLRDQVRRDSKFAPYRSDGEALAKNRDFRRAYQRYNRAFRSAQQVPGAFKMVTEKLNVRWK